MGIAKKKLPIYIYIYIYRMGKIPVDFEGSQIALNIVPELCILRAYKLISHRFSTAKLSGFARLWVS